jgi:hypothetical protein
MKLAPICSWHKAVHSRPESLRPARLGPSALLLHTAGRVGRETNRVPQNATSFAQGNSLAAWGAAASATMPLGLVPPYHVKPIKLRDLLAMTTRLTGDGFASAPNAFVHLGGVKTAASFLVRRSETHQAIHQVAERIHLSPLHRTSLEAVSSVRQARKHYFSAIEAGFVAQEAEGLGAYLRIFKAGRRAICAMLCSLPQFSLSCTNSLPWQLHRPCAGLLPILPSRPHLEPNGFARSSPYDVLQHQCTLQCPVLLLVALSLSDDAYLPPRGSPDRVRVSVPRRSMVRPRVSDLDVRLCWPCQTS